MEEIVCFIKYLQKIVFYQFKIILIYNKKIIKIKIAFIIKTIRLIMHYCYYKIHTDMIIYKIYKIITMINK